MAIRCGIDGIAYRNTGTEGVPVWNAITSIKDISVDLSVGKAEAGSRASRFMFHWWGLIRAPLTFSMIDDPAIDDYDILKTGVINRTAFDLAIANGAIATSGTQYWRAYYGLFGWKRGQQLEDVDTIDVEADLSYNLTLTPAFTTVP